MPIPLKIERIQWAFQLVEALGCDVGVHFGGFAAFMSHQALYVAQVGAMFEHVRGKRMAQGVHACLLFYTGSLYGILHYLLYAAY